MALALPPLYYEEARLKCTRPGGADVEWDFHFSRGGLAYMHHYAIWYAEGNPTRAFPYAYVELETSDAGIRMRGAYDASKGSAKFDPATSFSHIELIRRSGVASTVSKAVTWDGDAKKTLKDLYDMFSNERRERMRNHDITMRFLDDASRDAALKALKSRAVAAHTFVFGADMWTGIAESDRQRWWPVDPNYFGVSFMEDAFEVAFGYAPNWEKFEQFESIMTRIIPDTKKYKTIVVDRATLGHMDDTRALGWMARDHLELDGVILVIGQSNGSRWFQKRHAFEADRMRPVGVYSLVMSNDAASPYTSVVFKVNAPTDRALWKRMCDETDKTPLDKIGFVNGVLSQLT